MAQVSNTVRLFFRPMATNANTKSRVEHTTSIRECEQPGLQHRD